MTSDFYFISLCLFFFSRGGFFGRYFLLGHKKRLTPQDGNVTMARTLAEREEHCKDPLFGGE